MLLRSAPVLTPPVDDWPAFAAAALGVPVTLLSRGPTALDKEGRPAAAGYTVRSMTTGA